MDSLIENQESESVFLLARYDPSKVTSVNIVSIVMPAKKTKKLSYLEI